MKVLLVEPWLAGSHRRWAEGFAARSEHHVEVVGLPGELWRWRLQGGAPALAETLADRLDGVDVVMVSGLVDVAQLVGLCRRSLDPTTAVVVYQHESQLVYPASTVDRSAVLANWSSWLAADAVAFNSDFHRQAVRSALPRFLRSLPDQTHLPMLPRVVERFDVLPLGLDLAWTQRRSAARKKQRAGGPAILWPHRWESDKDPAAFRRALDRLDRAGLDYRVILAGETASGAAAERDDLVRDRPERVQAVGPFDRSTYEQLVGACDIVVSCSRHDFFGAGVVEAAATGAVVVAPHALAYPEVLGPGFLGYEPGRFGTALERAVVGWNHGPARPGDSTGNREIATWVRRFDWGEMAPTYDRYLAAVSAAVRSNS